MSDKALNLMWALRLEDGRCWGEAAATSPAVDGKCYQVEDAEAIFDDTGPDWHFITRPRGASKSSDLAAIALAWLKMDARPLANGHIVASSTDQATIVIDAAAGFVARTPELAGEIIVNSQRLLAPNGAWVEVLAQSQSGAWGLRDAHLLVVDEFCQWPETHGAKRVWTAITTAAPKVAHCKLVVLSSAGEPSHWSHSVYEQCKEDPEWRVSEMPGPTPWLNEAKLASLERSLLPSEYDRLVLNIWSESEDRAISPEDYDAAKRDATPWGNAPAGLKGGGYRLHFPRENQKYIITVDIGTKNDATVVCVAHKEPIVPEEPKGALKAVIDHMDRWQGSKKHHVDHNKVVVRIIELSQEYNKARVYADPDQFLGSLQDLNKRAVRAEEWRFSATSVGQVATALVQSFRNHQIEVPHSPVLRDELLSVKLRESAPGVTRLDHDRGGHDDQAVTIGMACHLLLGDKTWGIGAAFSQFMANDIAERVAPVRERLTPEERRFRQLFAPRRQRTARVARACEHRWSPNRDRCVLCGVAPEPVSV